MMLLALAKQRAKRKGLPFDLQEADIQIPERCPILGIPLTGWKTAPKGSKGPWDDSPSLDRIVPEKGYVTGNIRVISNKANRMRSNASLEEIQRLCQYLNNEENNG